MAGTRLSQRDRASQDGITMRFSDPLISYSVKTSNPSKPLQLKAPLIWLHYQLHPHMLAEFCLGEQ